MKVSAIYKELILQLAPIYGEQEASAMSTILLEELLAISRVNRLTDGDRMLSNREVRKLFAAVDHLLAHVPIQHILGYAYFLGRAFLVNKHTLVPRPETEELARLIIDNHQGEKGSILDIGTGSGCLAISIALELPHSRVTAWDISKYALEMAQENAVRLEAKVEFQEVDVLSSPPEKTWDLIVSNPPYIPNQDKAEMARNVLDFEPPEALFVSDHDPLLFYRTIGEYANAVLNPNGYLYFEIHERYRKEVEGLLSERGFVAIQTNFDMQGKPRMVIAKKAP